MPYSVLIVKPSATARMMHAWFAAVILSSAFFGCSEGLCGAKSHTPPKTTLAEFLDGTQAPARPVRALHASAGVGTAEQELQLHP
jgi:hypothetical protein